jgi:methylenetetrahydrofolate reductase (NADPH)
MEPHITTVLKQGFRVSVELVPSMIDREGHPSLSETMTALEKNVRPSFISVTQGAGGSSREQSPHILKALESYQIPRCAHLICGYTTRAEVLRYAADFYALGVRNVLVLKGDRPAHATGDDDTEGDYRYASECIRELRALYPDICIGAGAYPEAAPFDRVEVLKQKFEAGADFAITQMCFDTEAYRTLASRFSQPIIPGVCGIHSEEQAQQFAKRFGVKIPGLPQLPELIEAYRQAGAPGVHLFLLGDLDFVTTTDR